jgi:hypothetical protein
MQMMLSNFKNISWNNWHTVLEVHIAQAHFTGEFLQTPYLPYVPVECPAVALQLAIFLSFDFFEPGRSPHSHFNERK